MVATRIFLYTTKGAPQNHRLKYATVIVIVTLSLSLPNLLLAQSELTLESLAERVETLFSGQNDLKTRMAAIETRSAPTPTKTSSPTATSTPNARVTSQVRLTATAQAVKVRLTATARARATEETGNQLSEVEYLEIFTENAELVTMAMDGLAMSFRRPQLSDSNWRELLNVWLETFPYVQQNISDLVPPSSLKRGHDTFLRGIVYCVTGAELIADGVKNLESSRFTEAAGEFEDCTRITTEALNIVGR